MPATHVTQSDFDAKVLKAQNPVLVDFYADWCGPCQLAAPILDKLADEFTGKVDIVKVDVDANQDLAQKYGFMSIPTVVLFKAGQEVERKIGYGGERGYKDLIDKV